MRLVGSFIGVLFIEKDTTAFFRIDADIEPVAIVLERQWVPGLFQNGFSKLALMLLVDREFDGDDKHGSPFFDGLYGLREKPLELGDVRPGQLTVRPVFDH
jgi:hypothetical protein